MHLGARPVTSVSGNQHVVCKTTGSSGHRAQVESACFVWTRSKVKPAQIPCRSNRTHLGTKFGLWATSLQHLIQWDQKREHNKAKVCFILWVEESASLVTMPKTIFSSHHDRGFSNVNMPLLELSVRSSVFWHVPETGKLSDINSP